MFVDKVASSIHVDCIGVPSILCTQRRSCNNSVRIIGKGAFKGKENDAPSPEPQSALKDEEIKEHEYHA